MNKISKDSAITLVELPSTQFGVLNGEPSFDVYSLVKIPSRGIHNLEAVLRKAGYTNVQSINPQFHGKNGKLSDDNQRRIYQETDILGISSITRTSPQSIMLGETFKSLNPNKIVIAGGADPTFRYEEWLKQGGADIIVRGEGDRTIKLLMERLEKQPDYLDDIDGLAFKNGNNIKITNPVRLLTPEELGQLPHPIYDVAISKVAMPVIITSLGCPFNCDFCGVTEFYGNKYRTKPNSYVLEDLAATMDWPKPPFFGDDNFAGSPRRAIELCDMIYDTKLARPGSAVQLSVAAAKNPKLLEALKRAGISSVYVGIESIVDETLDSLGKPFNAEQNREAIKIFKEAGFWVHGMMMPGGEGDTLETLEETSEWINENLDSLQLFPPGPLPGTRLTKKMHEEGRILSTNYSSYDGQHVLIRPKNISPYDLQVKIFDMYKSFYSFGKSLRRLKTSPQKKLAWKIFLYTNVFRGIKKVMNSPETRQHLEFLKYIS